MIKNFEIQLNIEDIKPAIEKEFGLVTIGTFRKQMNSINGDFIVDDTKFFFKILKRFTSKVFYS